MDGGGGKAGGTHDKAWISSSREVSNPSSCKLPASPSQLVGVLTYYAANCLLPSFAGCIVHLHSHPVTIHLLLCLLKVNPRLTIEEGRRMARVFCFDDTSQKRKHQINIGARHVGQQPSIARLDKERQW